MYHLRIFLFTITALFGFAAIAQAQDEPAEEAAATEEAAEGEEVESETVLEILLEAGFWLYILIGLSIIMVTLVVYNFIFIREKTFLRPELVEELRPVMENLQFDRAKQICDENPTVVTNILYAGLERVDPENMDPDAIRDAMEEASTAELAAPFGLINYLNIVATLSPMVGLLGTVYGMIIAFSTISTKGMGQPQELAAAIQTALITTAGGLVVAIPAMFFYSFFKNRYQKIAAKVSKLVGDVYYDMLRGLRRLSA